MLPQLMKEFSYFGYSPNVYWRVYKCQAPLEAKESSPCPHRSLSQMRSARALLFLEPNDSSPCPHMFLQKVFLYHTPHDIVPVKYKNQNVITSVLVLLSGRHTLLTALHILFTSVSELSTNSDYCSQLCVYCWCLWVIVQCFRGISETSRCIFDSYMRISYSCRSLKMIYVYFNMCSAFLTAMCVFITAVVHCWHTYAKVW